MTDTTKILPKLRFPEFKNDGEWKDVKLGEVCAVNRGVRVTRNDLNNNWPYPVFQNTDSPLGFYNKFNVKANNPFVIIGGSAGLIGFCNTNFWAADDCVSFGDNNSLDKYFLYLTLLFHSIEIKNNIRGGNIPRIDRKSLEQLKVSVPTLPEQQKIAAFLTSLDEQISAHTKKLEALKAHKKGLMQQLFPANGEKTPKLRFPEFKNDGDWKEVRLGEIGTLKNGYAFKSDSYKESGVYKIITISNVKNGYLDLSKYNTINKIPSDISDHQILSIEDILISMTGNVGRVCMVSETDCLLNQRVGIFQVYEGINKYFIFSILNSPSFENAMILAAQGAAQPNIGKFDIEKFSLLMPPTTFEQQKIASFLTSIDEMIQAQDDKIRKLKTYKNGLMQQMFAK